MLTPLLALTTLFVSAAEPPRTGPGFLASLAVEVRAHGKILGPDYDYKDWRRLRRETSQKAIDAATDKDAEFYAWQNADEALDAMQAFSTRLKEVTARGAANGQEWAAFEKDIDAALAKTGLKAEKGLRQLYLDRIPRAGSTQAGPRSEHARVLPKLNTDRFKDPNFDGGVTRPAFKEPEVRAERPAYVYTEKPAPKAKSIPTLPKIDIFAYKPEGREAERLNSIKWTMGGVFTGLGAAVAIGATAPVWISAGLVVGAVALAAYGISKMPDGGWAETWSGPPKKNNRMGR